MGSVKSCLMVQQFSFHLVDACGQCFRFFSALTLAPYRVHSLVPNLVLISPRLDTGIPRLLNLVKMMGYQQFQG